MIFVNWQTCSYNEENARKMNIFVLAIEEEEEGQQHHHNNSPRQGLLLCSLR